MISVFYVSAAAGAGYTCPTYKEYVSCNPGYVLNGTGPGNECVPAPTCDAGYYLTDAGECDKCPTGYYCADGVKNACPDVYEYQQTNFPENYYNPTPTSLRISSGGSKSASNCQVMRYFMSEHGYIYDRANFNPATQQYDQINFTDWIAPAPGYYLTKHKDPDSLYYQNVEECLPGYYCPGKGETYCHYHNECGDTFGMYACPAGTYSGPGQSACTPCPDGYSNSEDTTGGHVDITSCVAECAAGYYVPSPGEPCTQITGSVPYYTAAHTVTYGDTSGDNYKKCPAPDPNTKGGNVWVSGSAETRHKTIKSCFRSDTQIRYTDDPSRKYCYGGICIGIMATHGISANPCYYYDGDDGNANYGGPNGETCVGSSHLISCDAGYWAPIGSFAHQNSGFNPCQPVDVGYYSPDGDLARYPCPDGTMSTGFGDGAANISDCNIPARKLHVGENLTLYLANTKSSTPALHLAMPNGDTYYGLMQPGMVTGRLNIQMPDRIYSVINPLDNLERIINPGGANQPPFEIIITPR